MGKKNLKMLAFLVVLLSFSLKAEMHEDLQSKNNKILSLIEDEIKTIEKNPYSSAELSHRLFELKSEKVKVIRESETKSFLEKKSNDPSLSQKEPDYKKSNDLFIDAQKFAQEIIKKYPNYQKNNEIYYSMAINDREFGGNKQAEELLKKSIKTSSKDNKTMYYAKIALAENYYNNKLYSEAISFYDEIIRNEKDEWHGKHLYNASWCYLKNRQFNKALNLLIESFNVSKNKNFISMQDQAISALPIFFAQADSSKEGIIFIEKNIKPSSLHLLNLAQASMSKNNFQITNEVLNAALRNSQTEKNINQEIKVRLTQLNIYKESKKEDLFFETAQKTVEIISKNKIEKDILEQTINIIKEVAGFMQINLVKQKEKETISYKKANFQKIIKYFDLLAKIDEQNSPQYSYFQGETSLSIQEFKKAIDFYTKSILNSKKQKNKNEYFNKSINSLLSTLELAKLKKNSEDHFLILALKNYLIYYPKSEKSQLFYQKLFLKYFERNEISKATNTLLVYKANYALDEKIHQEMLTQIIQYYIEKKETNKLSFWVSRIESGYLNFKKEYIEKSIEILGSLLFQKFQDLEKTGKLEQAMIGYKTIYDLKKYPKKVRADAAYALATILLTQNKSKNAFEWINKSFDLFTNEDLQKMAKSLYEASKTLRLLQQVTFSSKIAQHYLSQNCETREIINNDFFILLEQNQILSDNMTQEHLSIIRNFERCTSSNKVILESNHDIISSLIFSDRKEELIFFIEKISIEKKDLYEIGKYFKFKLWQEKGNNQVVELEKYKKLSKSYPLLNLDDAIKKVEIIDELKNKNDQLKIEFSQREKFDEELFNNELEQYFSIINKMSENIYAQTKNSSPEEAIFLQNLLSSPYLKLIQAIKNFSPSGVDSKYLDSFKQAMRPVIESLSSKLSNIESEKKAFLTKNHFFFELQKHVKFEFKESSDRDLLREEFLKHSARIYSNSLDKIRN